MVTRLTPLTNWMTLSCSKKCALFGRERFEAPSLTHRFLYYESQFTNPERSTYGSRAPSLRNQSICMEDCATTSYSRKYHNFCAGPGEQKMIKYVGILLTIKGHSHLIAGRVADAGHALLPGFLKTGSQTKLPLKTFKGKHRIYCGNQAICTICPRCGG